MLFYTVLQLAAVCNESFLITYLIVELPEVELIRNKNKYFARKKKGIYEFRNQATKLSRAINRRIV